MGTPYTVKPGDCMQSIADANNFFRWESIYYHEDNAELRKKRPDPSLLQENDEVIIPDLDDREEFCATGRSHVFQLRDPHETEIGLVLEESGQLLGNMKFELSYKEKGSDKTRTGYTTKTGELFQVLSSTVKTATLKVWKTEDLAEDPLTWELKIGDIDPIDTDTGIQDRLRNLGYDLGDEDGTIGDKTKAALKDFQLNVDLEATGEIDDDTRRLLDERSKEVEIKVD